MWTEDNDNSDLYVSCVNCGKSVFAGVSDCPYCHKDPSGAHDVCSHCGKTLPEGVAQCPYCKNFTDGAGPRQGGGLPRIFVIAGWLVVLGFVLPLLIALINWLR